MTQRSDPATPNPRDERRRALAGLLAGPGLRLMLLAIGSLAIGAIIGIAGRGFAVTDQLIGYALVGLLLLAPLPMLAGDTTDAVLLSAVRRRSLTLEAYQRIAAWAVPSAVIVVGMAVYPVVLAIGGIDLLGLFVVFGAVAVFGVLPVAGWVVAKLRGRREGP